MVGVLCVTNTNEIESWKQTDTGIRRAQNQDNMAELRAVDEAQWQNRGHVFLVADGMGAHAVGELASEMAANIIPHLYDKHIQEGPVAAIRKAFGQANLEIHQKGQKNRDFEGMGTTATAMLLRPEGLWVAHVGDTRAYRIRNGKIEQLSFDHSLVWELARRQKKRPEELQGVPSNVIVRSLGPEPLVQVDIEGPHPIEPGDRYLLCTDGLTGLVSDEEIGAVVNALPPNEACQFLISRANLNGGPDNITVLVAHVPEKATRINQSVPETKKPTLGDKIGALAKNIPWPFYALFCGIVLALAAVLLTMNEWPGGMLVFLAAAVSLLSGLVGLMILNAREKSLQVIFPHKKLQVYRETTCEIDEAFLQSREKLLNELETVVRNRGWCDSWDSYKQRRQLAQQLQQNGVFTDAFREQCRAMQLLMNAVHANRSKEDYKILNET